MVYAATTSSLAILEQLVQIRIEIATLTMVAIDFADDVPVRRIHQSDLPRDWRDHDHVFCRDLGSNWTTSGETLALRVPSSVNVLEDVILLNPHHKAIARCKVSDPIPVRLDRRLVALIERAPR